eukprot:TRINITY_DN2445_c1_g2_i1.p1 TRINITY_DN2445_c1_g2~~TRINITY_DN2445_c1_g2_i1.p1  ORF type:complete len:310 (+),score=99.69 TRINITY_DN2445_c1_g2_i1:57-986(+)
MPDNGSDSDEGEFVMIVVKNASTHEDIEAVIDLSSDVRSMKESIGEQHGIEWDRIRAIFKGKVLDDTEMVADAGIKEGYAVHIVVKAPEARPAAPQPVVAPTDDEDVSLPMMGSMRASTLRSLANNPMMDMLANNPDMSRELLLSMRPALREEMDRNPQLAAALNDPSMMRRMVDMMRNPGSLADLSRSMDHQITQIQNIPGGSAHLERLTHLLSNDMNTPEAPSSYTGPSSVPSTGPLPNPWAAQNQRMGGNAQQQQQQMPAAAPQRDFSQELQHMQDMGFTDRQANLTALRAANGNVEGAINMLLNR